MADTGKLLLLGNEAIARGCIEAGVKFASTYPGTPSSEIGGVFEKLADKVDMFFEYATNEKVAVEVAAAAAASGVRSFVFMKHVGVNVASDAIMTLAYSGADGGMVILSADDPSTHSSQNEQDNRYYAKLSLLPLFEPSTPAEAKEMIKTAFDVSEELRSPVFFRTTTRVNHARGIIELKGRKDTPRKGRFEKDPKRFVNIPAHARINRIKLLERLERAKEMSESSELNFVVGEGDVGVITSGVAYTYASEYLEDVSILKLGFTHPLPERKIADFMRDKDMVIVVEELEPFLEDEVIRIARMNGIDVPIFGKRTRHLPQAYEYSPDVISKLSSITPIVEMREPLVAPEVKLPSRPPMLCAGCPHRGTYYAAKKAAGKESAIYSSDIGCYTLGIQPPYHCADYLLCMGASVGAAGGFAEVTDQNVIAFIGDSTFFHAGTAGLINAVFNGHKFVLAILDNRTTAMTGHQPNPGTGRTFGDRQTNPLPIEPLVRGCGVDFVEIIDPYDLKASTDAFRRALDHDGVAVIISQRPCPLNLRKLKLLEARTYRVNQEKCVKCYICTEKFACPALYREGDEVHVDATMCIGCGGCAQVCPKNAIEVVE